MLQGAFPPHSVHMPKVALIPPPAAPAELVSGQTWTTMVALVTHKPCLTKYS